MPPSLLVVRSGALVLPVPLFLIWPLAAFMWLAIRLAAAFLGPTSRNIAALRVGAIGLSMFAALRGTAIDVGRRDGRPITVQFI